MKTTRIFTWTSVLIFSILIGCTKKPEDFPQLAPTAVKVMRSGIPEKGLRVIVYSPNLKSYVSFGATDENGHASIGTDSNRRFYDGAPVGTIGVVVRPEPFVIPEEEAASMKNMNLQELRAYNIKRDQEMKRRTSLIPPLLQDPAKTPLQFEVLADQKNSFEIDLVDPRWKAKR